jgi:hypothetical protein
MIRPTKHPKSGVYRVRLAVPAHLRETCGTIYGRRAELIENLKTKDPAEAKRRAPDAERRLRNMLHTAEAAHDGMVRPLTDKQAAALAGEWYHQQVAVHSDQPGPVIQWEAERSSLWDQVVRDKNDPATLVEVSLTVNDLRDATALLAAHGLPTDAASVAKVGRAVFDAKMLRAELMERRAKGDWSPDPNRERFPAAQEAVTQVPTEGPPAGITLRSILAKLSGLGIVTSNARSGLHAVSRSSKCVVVSAPLLHFLVLVGCGIAVLVR